MSCMVVDLLREGSLSTADRQRESDEEKKKKKKEGRHEDDDVDIRSEQEVGVSE